jgi:hypothetical protein
MESIPSWLWPVGKKAADSAIAWIPPNVLLLGLTWKTLVLLESIRIVAKGLSIWVTSWCLLVVYYKESGAIDGLFYKATINDAMTAATHSTVFTIVIITQVAIVFRFMDRPKQTVHNASCILLLAVFLTEVLPLVSP